jgi:hypothetical protein
MPISQLYSNNGRKWLPITSFNQRIGEVLIEALFMMSSQVNYHNASLTAAAGLSISNFNSISRNFDNDRRNTM